MKNMSKYIMFAMLGVFSWMMASCSDDIEREESPIVSPDCQGVYFLESNQYSYELDPAVTSITLKVGRDKKDAAVVVPIKVITNEGDVFVIPSSVSFAAGESEAAIEVTFSKAEVGTLYSLELTFDAEFINPYKGQSVADADIQRIKWEKIGMGVYVDGTIATFFGVQPMAVGVEIEKADLGTSSKYRFRDAYAFASGLIDKELGIYNGYPYLEEADILKENCLFMLNVSSDKAVAMVPAETGCTLGYGMISIGSIYGNISTNLDKYPLGTLEDDVITFPINSLYISMADYQAGGKFPASANPTLLYLSIDAFKKSLDVE